MKAPKYKFNAASGMYEYISNGHGMSSGMRYKKPHSFFPR